MAATSSSMNHLSADNSQQQQQPPRQQYPQPPKIVARPASVLLEPSMAYQTLDKNTRPRSHSHTVYSNYTPPPTTGEYSLSPSPSPSPSSHSNTSGGNGTGHDHASDNPVRFQNWRQPAHKSKLSKQYTPSEEDSEDETLGGSNADAKRRSKFLSGAALELNSGANDSMRALSRLSVSEMPSRSATPSLSESADSGSIKSTKKKISLGKRISKFFGGGSNKSSDSTSSSISTKSSASSINGSQNSAPARSSTASLAPIDELTPPGRAHNGLYSHQRSLSTPDQIGVIAPNSSITGRPTTPVMNPKSEEQRLRKARDSGFEDNEGKGHRRYSSSINGVPRGLPSRSSSPKLQSQSNGSSIGNNSTNVSNNRSSVIRSDPVFIDQQQAQAAAQQVRRSTHGNPFSTSSPQLRAHADRELQLPQTQHHNHRHSFMGAELGHSSSSSPLSTPSMPRRSSTPVAVSETLISKVDRERGSVCFQTPNTKKESFTKDANLDPVLSNLVQQHRRDFKTNQRLGGTPPPQQHHQQHSPLLHQGGSPSMRTSMYMDEQPLPPMMLARDPNARRDSSGSQHHYYHNGGMSSPQLSVTHPSSPGLYATTEAHMKRLSSSSQHQIQQQHPYFSTNQRMNFSGSQGSLNQYQTHSQAHGQHSPLTGPQRTSPKRLSSVEYFMPQQQQQYLLDPGTPPQLLQVSPFPSPSLGAVTVGHHYQHPVVPEMSLQQQQQQLEQLQHIRVQQQQLLLQQQQHLQQQLQQTRVAGLGLGALPNSTTAVPMPLTIAMPPQSMSLGTGVNMSPLMLTPPTSYLQQPHYHQQQQAVPVFSSRSR